MKTRGAVSLLLVLFLTFTYTAGCREATAVQSSSSPETNNTTDGQTVTAMLSIDTGSIKSLKIIQMGDGKTVVLNDLEKIGMIMDRLREVKITKALGTQGYTLTGYYLEFSLEDGSGTRTASIQLDSSENSYHAEYEKHFYEISDGTNTEKLNVYFAEEKYQ